MFIIHKNVNKTSIQLILKSNSTSFMFNNIFCEMKCKKVIHLGLEGLGELGTILILSWKCNFSIYLDIQVYYLDIQAITTFLCLLFVFYVLIPSIHSFFYLTTNRSPEKRHFLAPKSLPLPQFSTHRHRTEFIVKRKHERITNYLGLPINW